MPPTPPVVPLRDLKLKLHPDRLTLNQEVHTRPFPVVMAPVRVSHLSVLVGENGREAELAHLADLCRRFNLPAPSGVSFASIQVGDMELRWERHTEFFTYTLIISGPFDHPFVDPPISRLPADWLESMPGEVIAAMHLTLEPAGRARTRDELHEIFDDARLIGSDVVENNATVWSPFRIHADGFGRILIIDRELTDCRAGRLVQRLLELDTYRLLALLALPLAREAGAQFTRMNDALEKLVEDMATVDSIDGERRLLKELSAIAAEIEHVRARTSYRFSATRAYGALVHQRLAELREEQIRGIQTIEEFLDRRMTPALRTCESVCDRLEDLSRRMDRASDLLRTRIDLTLEAQNLELLSSMDRRARMQLWIQRTVEGLSIAAVSYYLLGLVKYAAEAVEGMGAPISAKVVIGIALPIVIGMVWLGVHRTHRLLEKHHPDLK